MPPYYEFFCPVKILCGRQAVDNIPYELDQLQARRPLIVTDPGVVQAGLLDVVIQAFSGAEAVIGGIFPDTPQDSSNLIVGQVARLYRENRCDALIAVGGGSVIDTCKGVNILVSENADDLMDFMGAYILKRPLKPFIVVPTTAGTGSEVTSAAVIANPERNVKMSFVSPFLFPDVAVLDPRMTMTMPPRITAATGMDALTHAVEAYTCLQKNPVSDAYAAAAIALVRDHLITAVTQSRNETARLAMANSALLAGIAFTNSLVGVVHGLAHAVGGVAHVPHGVANSIFLPFGMEYNLGRVADLYAELLLPLAGPEVFAQTAPADRARKAVSVVKDLKQKLYELCGLPRTLKEAGLPKDKLADIARTALGDGSMIMNPEAVDYDDALRLLQAAYE